jgi:hypothetical protein
VKPAATAVARERQHIRNTQQWSNLEAVISTGSVTATWGNNRTVGRCFLCGLCRGYITSSSCDYESLEAAVRRVWDGRQPGSCSNELWDNRRPVKMWTRKLRKLRRWKPLQGDNRWRYSRLRTLRPCCSERQCVWISVSAIVTCS